MYALSLAALVHWARRFAQAQPSDAGSSDNSQAVVVTATAIPGATIDIDKIPGNVQILSAEDLTREGSASLTGALNSNLSSININDDLDDPFQPDILYRGFEASPVLGTPQGLAVYQNGVRINEAFGDTVNWDLFPDIAINQVELVSSSPVYGLNALGGAISVTMKNGFTYQGGDLELSGGSYGQRAVTAQYGVNSGAFGFYVAGRALGLGRLAPVLRRPDARPVRRPERAHRHGDAGSELHARGQHDERPRLRRRCRSWRSTARWCSPARRPTSTR